MNVNERKTFECQFSVFGLMNDLRDVSLNSLMMTRMSLFNGDNKQVSVPNQFLENLTN